MSFPQTNQDENIPAIKKYGRDLTEAARQGKLDPVIGRDDEIRRVIHVLSRRTKNNPVLIDEAASKLRIEIDSMPIEIDAIERQVMQRQIEAEALKKESDAASKERLHKLERETQELQEESAKLKAHWQQEKNVIAEIRKARTEMEQARLDQEKAEREGDLQRAAELKYGFIPELTKKFEAGQKKLGDLQHHQKMLTEDVTADDIAAIVDIQLVGLRKLLADRKLTLTVTDAAKKLLAQRGWDPVYGARPLKRAIQTLLKDPLSTSLLEGKFKDGQSLTADATGDSIIFH